MGLRWFSAPACFIANSMTSNVGAEESSPDSSRPIRLRPGGGQCQRMTWTGNAYIARCRRRGDDYYDDVTSFVSAESHA